MLRIGTRCRLLWTLEWTCGFYKCYSEVALLHVASHFMPLMHTKRMIHFSLAIYLLFGQTECNTHCLATADRLVRALLTWEQTKSDTFHILPLDYRRMKAAHVHYNFQVLQITIRGDYKWCERLHKFIGKTRSHHL